MTYFLTLAEHDFHHEKYIEANGFIENFSLYTTKKLTD